jgi:amino acid transporter
MTERSREDILRTDAEDLRALGYAQQLYREMGGFSNFAVSFSIISVLTGAVLLFGYGLKLAGPIINTVGWPLVSLMTLTVAGSMAELSSAYPTAGGLYFWSFRLGGRGWAWATAWLNMIGQVTITAGINVAAAIYLIGAVTRISGLPADTRVPVLGPITGWYFQLLVMALITIPQLVVNVRGIRLTARLNDVSVWWHVGGVALVVGALTFAGTHHNDASFLFRGITSVPPLEAASAEIGGRNVPALVVGDLALPSPLFALVPGLADLYRTAPFALVFVLALLQAQWTYTGYDASAHVAEETVLARLNTAWGVFLSVAVSAVVGWLLLLALTWSIPGGDVARTAADPYPVLHIVYASVSPAIAHAIALIIGGAMWLCGVASITSMARMWYAFARDDGMPGAATIKRVSARTGAPVPAILLTSALSVLICVYAAAYSVVTSISTITLYLAYGIPIFLNLRARRRGDAHAATGTTAPWNLGRWGKAVNAIALAWIALIVIVFSLPPNELVLWTMLLVSALLLVGWRLRARHGFRGPGTAGRTPTTRDASPAV